MKKRGTRERLKPISLYGHDPRDVIRAFMQVDPKELKRLEEEERKHIQKKEQDCETMQPPDTK